jgi:NADH-quinone oxidoreductase subunit F
MPSTEFEKIVLAGADDHDLTKLSEYEKVGGYQALRKALGMERQAVLDELIAASVRGRGGAGFPSGRKASFVPKPEQTTKPIYLTINADESEPGTFKDREIMLRVPHRLIEGALITAYTIGSNDVFIYIRGEYLTEYEVVLAARDEARARGLEGANILGSGWNCTITLHRGAGAYICGEETSLLESLEGKRGQPRSKPPFPAVSGLYASPTLINNVETIATVPPVIERGGAWYATLGVENSHGTRVFSLSGNVVNGGNYELPLGISLRELIYDIGGGIPDGRSLKAIIPGGSSTPILTADQVDVTLDYDAVGAAGSMLGSGAIIAIDDRACMVQLALRVAQFYQHESCGKCTPCREGTRWMTAIIQKIEDGQGTNEDLDLLVDICGRILGRSLCPLGDAAAMPIASYVDRFRDEFQAHIDQGCCPYGDHSSLDGLLSPVQQHARMHRELAVIA